jgi:ribosome maturation factor RimP
MTYVLGGVILVHVSGSGATFLEIFFIFVLRRLFDMNRKRLDAILELVNSKIREIGYECIEVEWVEKERALRIYIDKNEGIFLNDCVAVNNILKDFSELDDSISGSYHLEVSSPGVNRPLRFVHHFQKAIGETVRLRVNSGGLKRVYTGKLVDVMQEGEVVLEWEGTRQVFPLEQLLKANVIFNWNQN